jgi:K+-transporting ATPase ATPase C chain
MISFLRQAGAALRLLVVLTLVLGVGYPVAVWAAGRIVADKADGSFVEHDGEVVGSSLLGQVTEGDEWFRPRPSVAGDGYDPRASGTSNLGPENVDLLASVEERRADVAEREGVDPALVPVDALTASGSGLDPHISPEYAWIQVPRVADARGMDVDELAALVEEHVAPRPLGILGEETVNVLELNIAVAEADAS